MRGKSALEFAISGQMAGMRGKSAVEFVISGQLAGMRGKGALETRRTRPDGRMKGLNQ
jgi:hypothetical protein